MEVYSPKKISQALKLLGNLENVKALAGGTDFVVHYKQGKLLPGTAACNILGLKELHYIREERENLYIGPLTTHQELVDSPLVNQYAGVLAEAAAAVGSPQIRNRGTIGGNISTASPAGDTLPALVCLDAKLIIQSLKGQREETIREFFLGPGKTLLASGELVTGIIIPKLENEEKAGYAKLGARNALAISIAGVAAKVTQHGHLFTTVEVALGSVGPTILYERMPILEGIPLTNREMWERVQTIKEKVSPITDIRASKEYRREMTASLLFQLLQRLYEH